MICPKCKNNGWKPLEHFSNPLKNLGYKQHFKTFNLRHYACLQCGYKFVTKEEYYRDITPVSQTDMFEANND
jgi:hypothetical protein